MDIEELCTHIIWKSVDSSYVTLSFKIARPAWAELQEAEVFKEFKRIVETLEKEYLFLDK